MSNDTKISVQDVYKSFGGNHVLRGAFLDIRKGESMVVIGGSGTGKSVLIKCIIGLLMPEGGKVYVDGQDVTSLKERELNELRKKFGMLFQWGALFDSMRVWENVGFGLKQHTKLRDSEIKDIAIDVTFILSLK